MGRCDCRASALELLILSHRFRLNLITNVLSRKRRHLRGRFMDLPRFISSLPFSVSTSPGRGWLTGEGWWQSRGRGPEWLSANFRDRHGRSEHTSRGTNFECFRQIIDIQSWKCNLRQCCQIRYYRYMIIHVCKIVTFELFGNCRKSEFSHLKNRNIRRFDRSSSFLILGK